ncbi:MAG TPA: glycoside hydrolase family 38 C-terminal domain-containing protein [Gemmatimonadaceae bacterium]|nr:glycoside hydrolase family 38 C-terminal domain-containing protein [Gemmatimonadaceae bacterium]
MPIPRRDFLSAGAASVITPWLGLAQHPLWRALIDAPAVPRSPGNTKVLHLIGYAHIDAAWLWPWRDGADEALDTLQSATDRMAETPEFKYVHSSTAHYRWIERADPRLFAIIKQRVAEHRMEPIGGWIVEPDCNLPSTESFVRHGLYGQRYFRDHVGAMGTVGANPDSFGHAAGLPQILKKAGLRHYCFMRPQENEMTLPLVFWWESPDGSRVLTGRIHDDYDGDPDDIPKLDDNQQLRINKYFQPGLDHAMFWYGVGDHGGGPTKLNIATILKLKNNPALPELRFSTLAEFFATVEQSSAAASLPVVRTELQHHSRGCYSAHGEGKALNRRAERWLTQAESIAAFAQLAEQHPYPTAEFAESWWKVLFCQFHDMMAGTSLYDDYRDVRDQVGYACEVAQTSRVEALEVLARSVDTSTVPEGCVFAYNPLPWPRLTVLELHMDQEPYGLARITHLSTKDGTRIPFQWRVPDSMTGMGRWTAHVELPACGYRVFTVDHGEVSVASADPKPIGTGIKIDDRGFGITSMPVAAGGPELLAEPIGLVVIDDRSDTWSHDVTDFRDVIGRPTWVNTVVVEDGPLMRVTRQIATWRTSTINMDIIERAGFDAVELKFVIDWHEHEQILKLDIPTTLTDPQVFAKVPGATIPRTAAGTEEPAQDYIAIQGKLGNSVVTLGVCNAQTYSYDVLATPAGALVRTIVIRSSPFARHRPATVPVNDTRAWQDQGRQERSFWLVRGVGEYRTLNLDRRALEFQTPAEYVVDSRHPGKEAWEASFLSVSPANVIATAVKKAEDDDRLIVRLQETTGQTTHATVASERFKWSHPVSLGAWEIKTVAIRGGTIAEVNLLELT